MVISKEVEVSPARMTTDSGRSTCEESLEDRRMTRSEARLLGMETVPALDKIPLSSEAWLGTPRVRAAPVEGKKICARRIPRIKGMNRIPERAVCIMGIEINGSQASEFRKKSTEKVNPFPVHQPVSKQRAERVDLSMPQRP
jgi:hypothetical protein